jgi:hypothetical protein
VTRRLFLKVVGALLISASASAQIAFDAASTGATFATSWSHTVGAGSNRALVVCEFDDTASNLLTAVTWNTSESLAKILEVQTPGDRYISMWLLLNPSSATANIVLTTTAGAMRGWGMSYTGVSALDVSGSGTASSSSPVSDTITVASNAWIVSCLKENAGTTVTWTNATENATTVGGGLHGADSAGTRTGSQATSGAYGGGVSAAILSASFTPTGGGGGSARPPCGLRLLGVGCEVQP